MRNGSEASYMIPAGARRSRGHSANGLRLGSPIIVGVPSCVALAQADAPPTSPLPLGDKGGSMCKSLSINAHTVCVRYRR